MSASLTTALPSSSVTETSRSRSAPSSACLRRIRPFAGSRSVPVGLNRLIYGDVFHWGQLMAASVITTVPVVALYMFIHRWMVEGLAAGSVKG